MILGIDFDGTCVTHAYPDVGQDIGAVPVLQALVAAGHQLILWTMRSDGRDDPTENSLQPAVDWFARHGIPLHGINQNPDQAVWTKSPKAYCHYYVDDAAVGVPLVRSETARPYIDWVLLRLLLVELLLLPDGA